MSELFGNNGSSNGASWRDHWAKVEAAQDYEALANGVYECEPSKVELFRAKSGTEGLKVHWRVVAGEFTGRRVWQDLWLSPAALPFTKRVLQELRMGSPDDILPDGIVCAVQVVSRTNDKGTAYNEVKRVDYLRTDENPFPPDSTEAAPEQSAKITLEQPSTEADNSTEAPPEQSAKITLEQPSTEADNSPPPSPPSPEAVGTAAVPLANSPDSPQPVQVVLDQNYGTMIGPQDVMRVAQAVPENEPTDNAELARLLPDMPSNSVMLALQVLTQHGMKSKYHGGTPLYWWAGNRPVIHVASLYQPVAAQPPADNQFFAALAAQRAKQQEGATNDA